MKIDGVEITCITQLDGYPVKNKLPAEIRDRLLTKNQWLEKGFIVKDGVKGYRMHSNMLGAKLFEYFFENQVTEIKPEEEVCATCLIRENRFCPVMGDYVSMTHRCSEWMNGEYE